MSRRGDQARTTPPLVRDVLPTTGGHAWGGLTASDWGRVLVSHPLDVTYGRHRAAPGGPMVTAQPQRRSIWPELTLVGAVTFLVGVGVMLLFGTFGG